MLIKLGRGMYPNRVKGYFEQYLRLWEIKLLLVRGREKSGSMPHRVLFSTVFR